MPLWANLAKTFWGPEGHQGWGPKTKKKPKGGGPELWKGPNFALFFSLFRPYLRSFFLSLWGSSRGILVVFEALGPSNVHVWSSRAVVGNPGGLGDDDDNHVETSL